MTESKSDSMAVFRSHRVDGSPLSLSTWVPESSALNELVAKSRSRRFYGKVRTNVAGFRKTPGFQLAKHLFHAATKIEKRVSNSCMVSLRKRRVMLDQEEFLIVYRIHVQS